MYLLFFVSLSCSGIKNNVVFSGYACIGRANSSITFDTINIAPVLAYKKPFSPNKEDSVMNQHLYWEVFSISEKYNILHYCSSYEALISDNFNDSLSIGDTKFSIKDFFADGTAVKFRIFQILSFKLYDNDYIAILGKDMLSSDSKTSNIIFIVNMTPGHISLLCPPLNLNYGTSNTQFLYPYYINDFNRDGNLDFLQWNSKDSIIFYSIVNNVFIRQEQFIKVYSDPVNDSLKYIDIKNSNWPYHIGNCRAKIKEKERFYKFDSVKYGEYY